jgi:hypothetical protein
LRVRVGEFPGLGKLLMRLKPAVEGASRNAEGRIGIGEGHLFNHNAWSLQVRNRFSHSYKESRELEMSGAGGQPIKVMMIPSDANL